MQTFPAEPPRYCIRGVPVLGFRDLAHAVDYLCNSNGVRQGRLVAINAEKILTMQRDARSDELIRSAEYCYADGISIVRSVRKKYPQAEISRVAGVDLWLALMQQAAKQQTPVFLLGASAETLQNTVDKLRQQYAVNIVGSQHGYFAAEDSLRLFARIRDSGAKIITVAMGSPRQEIIMQQCQKVCADALYMGVGGSYDVFTGRVKRAPLIWQKMGLEWLYRLLSQPARIRRQFHLWRYLYWHYRNQL